MCSKTATELLHARREILRLETELAKWKPSTADLPSPRDIISRSDIIVDNEKHRIVIDNVPGKAILVDIEGTHSMEPLFAKGHNLIITDGFKYEDLVVGDVVVFDAGDGLTVHAIKGIELDAHGRLYTTGGYNNEYLDPVKLRDEHIKYLYIIHIA